MRLLISVFLVLFLSNSGLFAQCKADSVITYRIVAGMNQIASIEYYSYDSRDSAISHSLIDYLGEKPLPIERTDVTCFKSGSNLIKETRLYLWQQTRAEFVLNEIYQIIRNKKNQVIAESYLVPDEKSATNPPIVTSQFIYTYSKSGDLISKEFSDRSNDSGVLLPESKIVYTYSNGNQTQVSTWERDSADGEWIEKWRNDFKYDSLNILEQTVSYEFRNEAWIPVMRTVSGADTAKPIKWNIIQEWDWARETWTNKYYYVFQLNEKGQTIAEVHLDWVRKEWVINLTVYYVYDKNGFLMQILNGEKQVIVNRFCRNSEQ